MLAQYCRHVVEARRIAALIDALTPGAPGEVPAALDAYAALLRLQQRETAALKAVATALRLTQQSRLRPETAGRRLDRHQPGPAPWEA